MMIAISFSRWGMEVPNRTKAPRRWTRSQSSGLRRSALKGPRRPAPRGPDRLYGIRMHKGQTMGAMHADYGASARNSFTKPGERFHFAPNGIYEGFTVVAWNLADAGPASGGFWCIPGSHKSHFKLPRQIHEAPEKASCVVIPDVPAGSVVLFSEAVMHGTAPWRADHERRTLLYKYCVSQMAWSRARVLPPPDVPLTPRQQALLTEPADPHTFVPSLFSDGPGVKRA